MLKKMPIRLRLTLLSISLLAVCCIGITVILNFSANHMADIIEATPVAPAMDLFPSLPLEETLPTMPAENSQIARTSFLYQSIFYVISIICAGGALTYWISGKALNPLKELSSQMKNRTVHNLSEDLPVPKSRDEIADLTLSFNEMSRKLDEAFAMQKRFSQSAAHELRTPLTVLKTKVEVFNKRENHTADDYTKLMEVITTHTDRLSHLVKDLLDLTNMETVECKESIALKLLLEEVQKEVALFAKSRMICVSVLGEEKNIFGNNRLLYRAFYNLVENAVKYNQENGTVTILLSEKAGNPVVTITDTGIGIPADLRELVFEPFFRVEQSRSRQMGGAGLGLPIVKAILEKQGGTIAISENPAGGTVFEVDFCASTRTKT